MKCEGFILFRNICCFVLINEDVDRGTGTQACDCGHDCLWVRFSLEEMKYLFSFLRCI